MYQESPDLQTQVNALSEELRNIKMQLLALYKHLNVGVNAKREVVGYQIQEYSNQSCGLQGVVGGTAQTLTNIKQ